nr:hypothetical protein [Tanacetum cinerariifolium]
MFGTIPPILPPLGTNIGNTGSPNRVDTIPTTNDTIDTTTTTNVAQNVADENLPQLLDSRGDGPFLPLPNLSTPTNPLRKPQNQWTHAEARLANQDKRLKSNIISFLPNDVMKAVIKCRNAKATWNDLILAREGQSNTRDTKIGAVRLKFNAFKALKGEKVNGTFTRLKCLLIDLKNSGVIIPQAEVNATFVNSLPGKFLSLNQTQRANNSNKNDFLATLYGKYNYEEGLIDQIYESETQQFTIQASCLKALISNNLFQDNNSDVKEDLRSTSEFLADLNDENQERALLKELLTAIRAKVGKLVRKTLWKEIDIVKERLSYCRAQLDKGDVNLRELINLMKDMVYLVDSANVFKEAKAKRDKVSFEEDIALELVDEAKAKAAEEAKIAEEAKENI